MKMQTTSENRFYNLITRFIKNIERVKYIKHSEFINKTRLLTLLDLHNLEKVTLDQ